MVFGYDHLWFGAEVTPFTIIIASQIDTRHSNMHHASNRNPTTDGWLHLIRIWSPSSLSITVWPQSNRRVTTSLLTGTKSRRTRLRNERHLGKDLQSRIPVFFHSGLILCHDIFNDSWFNWAEKQGFKDQAESKGKSLGNRRDITLLWLIIL